MRKRNDTNEPTISSWYWQETCVNQLYGRELYGTLMEKYVRDGTFSE